MSNEELMALNKELEEKLQDRTKELNDLEEKFKTIAENSLMGIAIIQDNKIKYVNKQSTDLTGFTVDETKDLSPTRIFEFIHPKDRLWVLEQLRKKQEGVEGYLTNYQYRIIDKLGEVRWVDNYSKSIDYMGKPADLVSVIDITERKNAEQKLKESEEMFRTIAEHSNIGITIIQGGKIKYANEAMSRINEYNIAEMLDWTSLEMMDQIYIDDRQSAKNHLQGRLTGNLDLPDTTSYRIKTKKGNIKLIESYSKTVTYQDRFADLALVMDVTEQNMAQERLKESEEKYRLLFENMNSAFAYSEVVVNDDNKPIDYRFIEANSQFEKLTGLKVKDIIGKTVTEVLPGIENDPADWIGRYGNVGLTGEPLIAEDYSEPLDRWYTVSGYSTKKGFFAVTFSDITNRKKAEQELKESEEKFRTITEFSTVGIVIIQDKKVKYLNKAMLDINEYTLDEVMEWTPKELLNTIYPEDRKQVIKYLRGTQTGDSTLPAYSSYRTIAKSGEIKWVDSYSKVIKYQGRFAGLALITDVTEQKRSQEKLKESEEKYRHLYENSPFSIVLMDCNGKIVDMNTKTTELFGYKKEDIIDKNYLTLTEVFPNDTKPGLRLIRDLMSKEGPDNPVMKPRITEIYNKEKELIWTESELSRVNISGKPMIQAIIQDITEKKLADEKLKESEQILRQQNLELKELDRLKTDFISIAAHDLKTPLISVGGYIDLILLREKELKVEVKEDLNRVLNNVHRLEVYINRLLDVMKIDAKKVELVKREENILSIIKNTLSDLEFQIGQKDLTINIDISESLELQVDHFRISQVFLNLLSNAVKFTPEDGIIDISCVEDDQSVIFSIKDNGKGLTRDEMQKIFGKFVTIEQGVDGYSTLDKGSGLGLFITKGFIEAHGGKIWVESKGIDLGTEFSFVLPKL